MVRGKEREWKMSEAGEARVIRFEVILGLLYAILFVAFIVGGFVFLDARNDLREENLRANEIRSVENCNDVQQLKLSIRQFLVDIDAQRTTILAAERAFSPLPGGSFINERGERQWRGCGEFPPPLD